MSRGEIVRSGKITALIFFICFFFLGKIYAFGIETSKVKVTNEDYVYSKFLELKSELSDKLESIYNKNPTNGESHHLEVYKEIADLKSELNERYQGAYADLIDKAEIQVFGFNALDKYSKHKVIKQNKIKENLNDIAAKFNVEIPINPHTGGRDYTTVKDELILLQNELSNISLNNSAFDKYGIFKIIYLESESPNLEDETKEFIKIRDKYQKNSQDIWFIYSYLNKYLQDNIEALDVDKRVKDFEYQKELYIIYDLVEGYVSDAKLHLALRQNELLRDKATLRAITVRNSFKGVVEDVLIKDKELKDLLYAPPVLEYFKIESQMEGLDKAINNILPKIQAYEVKISKYSNESESFILKDKSILKNTKNEKVGYIGYEEEAILFEDREKWNLCFNGKVYPVEMHKNEKNHYSRNELELSRFEVLKNPLCN